jgi:uncharacterized membrane protein YozB (DUF420 family)
MASLLNTTAPLSSELSLIVQLIALAFLVVGFIVVKQKKYMPHGSIMFVATLANLVSVLTVMVPVALRLGRISVPGFNLLFRTHAVMGVIVLGATGFIQWEWRFQKPGPTCFKRKKWMLGFAIAWIVQVILGIILFMRLNPVVIPG